MDGDKLATGTDGKLIKGDLAKVFVMGKEQGSGNNVPDTLKNGDWAYAAYDASSKPLMEDFAKCRACHLPLAQKDFVHRYDEYFQTRAECSLRTTQNCSGRFSGRGSLGLPLRISRLISMLAPAATPHPVVDALTILLIHGLIFRCAADHGRGSDADRRNYPKSQRSLRKGGQRR